MAGLWKSLGLRPGILLLLLAVVLAAQMLGAKMSHAHESAVQHVVQPAFDGALGQTMPDQAVHADGHFGHCHQSLSCEVQATDPEPLKVNPAADTRLVELPNVAILWSALIPHPDRPPPELVS
jgi:hypothetical protein